MSDKKKILIRISVICAIGLLLCLLSIIIYNIQEDQETKENMLEAMECWAEGEEYHGDCLEYWKDIKYTEIEEKAIEIVKEIKSEPEKFIFFLNELEDKEFTKQSIQNEINKLSLSFEEKISLQLSANLWYYQLPEITKSEVMAYVKQKGSKELHLKSGEGGFYDGEEDTSSRKTVGIKGSPLYDAKSTSYFGDFKCERKYGVKLNSYYQEQSYSYTDYYFKNQLIEFDPRNYDCYYVGKYLFAVGSSDIHVYDTKIRRTVSFD